MRAVVKQLGERGQRSTGPVAEQPARGGIGRDHIASLVSGDDAVREGFEQRARLFPFAAQIIEASFQLVMHRAQCVHVVRQLRHAHVRELRGTTHGNVVRRARDSDQRPSERPRHYPGDESRREEEHQARGGDRLLNRMNLGIHARQRGRHACHREARWGGGGRGRVPQPIHPRPCSLSHHGQ